MTSQKVTDLAATTAPADTDLLLVTENPGGSPVSKKSTLSDALRIAHASVSATAVSASQSLSATTWTKVTQFTAEATYAAGTIVASHSGDSLKLVNAGRYLVTWMVSFTGANAAEYRMAAYVGANATVADTRQDPSAILTTASTNEHCATYQSIVTTGSANQYVTAAVYSDGANAFAVKESTLTAIRIA
tara:strand:+ start:88 stop:654 length:567 start_codon:yes stop_codon:yes gene_type:complete